MAVLLLAACALMASTGPVHVAVEDGQKLTLVNVPTEQTSHEGKKGRRGVESSRQYDGNALALVDALEFTDGTIEVDVAGRPAAGSDESVRGFVGRRVPVDTGRPRVRMLLRPSNQRTSGRSTQAQPF